MTILLAGLIGFAVSISSSISSNKAVDNYKEQQKIEQTKSDKPSTPENKEDK